MKRPTISLAELTYQILQEQRAQKIVEAATAAAASIGGELKKLGDEIVAAGMDLTDTEIQAALLSKLLDANGNLGKIDASDVKDLEQKVQEGRKYLKEGGGAIATIAHTAGDVLGNAALIEAISHGLAKATGKKDADVKAGFKKLQTFLKNTGEVAGFAGKVIERFFKWIAAKWGGGEKTQKVFGIVGMMLFVLLMAVVAVVSFPSMTSLVSIAIGATALLGKALELVKLVKHLVHTVGSHQEEIEKTDDKTELQKKIDKWMNAPISGPDKSMGDMARNMSMRK